MHGFANAYDRDKLLRQMQREGFVETMFPLPVRANSPATFVDRVLCFLDEHGDVLPSGRPSGL